MTQWKQSQRWSITQSLNSIYVPTSHLHDRAIYFVNLLGNCCSTMMTTVLPLKASLDPCHYSDVIMNAMASQITSLTIIILNRLFRCRSNKTSKLRVNGLWGIHRWAVNAPHKWPVTWKMMTSSCICGTRILSPLCLQLSWYLPALDVTRFCAKYNLDMFMFLCC